MVVKNHKGRLVDVALSHALSVLSIEGIEIVSVDDEVYTDPQYAEIKTMLELLPKAEIENTQEEGEVLDYSVMSYNDLKTHAKAKGLKIVGVKKDNLIKALRG